MKKRLLIAVICCVFAFVVNGQVKSADTLIRRIFTAIKNEDKAGFVKIFPDYSQMQVLISEMFAQIDTSAIPKEARNRFANITEAEYRQQILTEFEDDFAKVIDQLKAKGIAPKKMKFVNAEHNVMGTSENGIQLRMVTGTIYFQIDTAQYVLPFSDVIWSEKLQGYFGVDLKTVRGRWEPESEEGEEIPPIMELKDSTVEIRDVIIQKVEQKEVPPPPPPHPEKPGKKPPVKKPGRKTDN